MALWEEKKAIRAIYGTEKQRIPGASAHKPITHAQKDTHVCLMSHECKYIFIKNSGCLQ